MAMTVPHCDPSIDGLDNRVTQCDRQLGSCDLASVTLCQLLFIGSPLVPPRMGGISHTNGRYISIAWRIWRNSRTTRLSCLRPSGLTLSAVPERLLVSAALAGILGPHELGLSVLMAVLRKQP